MKIIVPMAGRGSRLRPHTLTTPKPLIPIAGKPIVQRLVEDITQVCDQAVDEIAFIIGDFGKEVEEKLVDIAKSLGARGTIYHQTEPLGTAHAILCAKRSLSGNVVVAFADTLFRADFTLDSSADGVIWTKKVDDPRQFGVVKMNEKGHITDFVEKPETKVSDQAIIGIYYFRDGQHLSRELQYLIDHDIKDKGEFQITSALENMKNQGCTFVPGTVSEWMDCGNKEVTIETNGKILSFVNGEEKLIDPSAEIEDSEIVEPCYIGKGARIKGSKIGPYVSVGRGTVIEDSRVTNTLIQNDSVVRNAELNQSMIGNKAVFDGNFKTISIGDYSKLE